MSNLIIRDADRGQANFGWLNARYSFSFANYYHLKFIQFGALRVLNDDIIAAGGGFPTHPHQNMEIITIPLSGELYHKDSTGNEGSIKAGEIQVMTAGTGIYHSEFNPSQEESLNLLQIWVFPDKNGHTPRYQQMKYDLASKKNDFVRLIHPNEEEGALSIKQNAYFSMGEFEEAKKVNFELHNSNNGLYVFVLQGELSVDGLDLSKKDAVGLTNKMAYELDIKPNTKVLTIEIPLNF